MSVPARSSLSRLGCIIPSTKLPSGSHFSCSSALPRVQRLVLPMVVLTRAGKWVQVPTNASPQCLSCSCSAHARLLIRLVIRGEAFSASSPPH